MLADQEVELVEKHIGEGWKIRNLLYIHRQCSNNVFYGGNEFLVEHIDLFSMLDSVYTS